MDEIELASRVYVLIDVYSDMEERHRLIEAFKAGADWQRNNLWHDLRKNPKDLPPIGKEVYCHYENDDELINMRTNDINIDRNEDGWYLYP